MTSKVIGRIIPNFVGDYDEKTAYHHLDVVTYKGSSYLCKSDSTGQEPGSGDVWALLAKAGDAPDTKEYALIKDVPKISYDADKHVLTLNDKQVDLETKQKIDKDNADKELKPSDYPEGFSYELKKLDAVSLDRSSYHESIQEGTEGMLTTTSVDGYARQRLEVLDSTRPITFARTGHDDQWNDWELVTTWVPGDDSTDSANNQSSNQDKKQDDQDTKEVDDA